MAAGIRARDVGGSSGSVVSGEAGSGVRRGVLLAGRLDAIEVDHRPLLAARHLGLPRLTESQAPQCPLRPAAGSPARHQARGGRLDVAPASKASSCDLLPGSSPAGPVAEWP